VSDLNRLLQRLCDADFDFVIVGGFAAVLHGSSLMTRDLDVCALLTQENVTKLREVLHDLHPVHRLSGQKLPFLDNPAPGVSVNNLYLGTDFGPVDLLSSILGVGDFESVRANAVEVTLFGRLFRVISLDDLIRAKEALTRDKDQQAVLQLRAIREKLKAAQQAAAAGSPPPSSDPP
jgi:predicted nucleotidyltransferase